jgi:hypothetical protein
LRIEPVAGSQPRSSQAFPEESDLLDAAFSEFHILILVEAPLHAHSLHSKLMALHLLPDLLLGEFNDEEIH